MRRILVMVLLQLWLAIGSVAPSAAAVTPTDSTSSAPSSASRDSIRVFLEDGQTVTARSVRNASLDMVAIVLPDSSIRYVAAARVRRILDAEGRDRTREILEHRGAVPTTREMRLRSLTWRGYPYPETRSFLITELGVMRRLDRYPFPSRTSRTAVTFDLGWMKNVGTRHAIGFSGYAMPGDQTRLGIRARYRRWLSRGLSVDVSPGVILGGEDSGANYDAPGFVLGTTLNAGDLFAVMIDTELARYWEFAEDSPPFVTRVNHTDVTYRAGAKIGSGLGLVGSAVLVGLVIVLVAGGAAD
jgi:hypothetical protein